MPEPLFTVLIDGGCPLCRREADLLRRLDRGRGRLALEDIAAPGFDPGRYGVTMDALMGTIHGVLPGGGLVTGPEVFRRAYSAVGWGWLTAPTGWPVLRPLTDRAYAWFARHRLRLTGRQGCEGGACRVAAPGGAARGAR
jgi:predicted DCC family thiol-disulfide oxidoreductase YuxK